MEQNWRLILSIKIMWIYNFGEIRGMKKTIDEVISSTILRFCINPLKEYQSVQSVWNVEGQTKNSTDGSWSTNLEYIGIFGGIEIKKIFFPQQQSKF